MCGEGTITKIPKSEPGFIADVGVISNDHPSRQVTVVNTLGGENPPQTGDSVPLLVLGITMLLSLAGICVPRRRSAK